MVSRVALSVTLFVFVLIHAIRVLDCDMFLDCAIVYTEVFAKIFLNHLLLSGFGASPFPPTNYVVSCVLAVITVVCAGADPVSIVQVYDKVTASAIRSQFRVALPSNTTCARLWELVVAGGVPRLLGTKSGVDSEYKKTCKQNAG